MCVFSGVICTGGNEIMLKKRKMNRLTLNMISTTIPKWSTVPGVICILISVIANQHVVDGAEVVAYKGISTPPSIMHCSKVKLASDTGCVCVSGLWRFYSGCSSHFTMAGESHCFLTRERQPTYAMELLTDRSDIVLIRERTKMSIKSSEIPKLDKIDPTDVFITGSPYTLKGPLGKVCIYPQDGAFCSYQPQEFTGAPVTISPDCDADFPFFKPLRCDYIKPEQTCEQAENELDTKVFKLAQRVQQNSSKNTEDNELLNRLSDADYGHENGGDSNHLRRKRSKRRAKKKKLGRTFIGVAGQEFERTVSGISEDDEDYIPPEVVINMTTGQQDEVLNEIWNYVESSAEIEMQLKKKIEGDIDYDLPFFKLLHMSKNVMKKFCPEEYVPAKFFDIAVQSFIQIQVKRFSYDSPNANQPGYQRIFKALEKCVEQTDAFPFITPDSDQAIQLNLTCDPNATENGLFFAFNESMEVNVSSSFVGYDRDPIVETAWKIFLTTASICFENFNESSYNDHHRFIAWMTPLFTNAIHEIWMNGSSNEYTYGQFLGNLHKIMTKVAYCAAASRLSNSTLSYPWELSIPLREGSTGNETDSAGPVDPAAAGAAPAAAAPDPAAAAPAGRRKREVEIPFTECLVDSEATECFKRSKDPPVFYIR